MTATAVTAGPQLVFKDSKKSGGVESQLELSTDHRQTPMLRSTPVQLARRPVAMMPTLICQSLASSVLIPTVLTRYHGTKDAQKIKSIQQNDLLKVRVGEWDASGFNSPERFNH